MHESINATAGGEVLRLQKVRLRGPTPSPGSVHRFPQAQGPAADGGNSRTGSAISAGTAPAFAAGETATTSAGFTLSVTELGIRLVVPRSLVVSCMLFAVRSCRQTRSSPRSDHRFCCLTADKKKAGAKIFGEA